MPVRAWLAAPLLHIASVNGSASRQLEILRGLRARGFRGEVSVGTYREAVDREPEAVRTLMGESDLCFMNREEATLLFPEGVPDRPTGVLCITDGSEAIEVVGDFAEKIEDMSLPMRGAIVATGDDAQMWNNLDGCEEWGICESLEEAKEHLSMEPEDEETEGQ